MFVVDGTNLLLLGVHRTTEQQRLSKQGKSLEDGDLGTLLAIVEWLLLCDKPFKVYFDRQTYKAVPMDQRDLYFLLRDMHQKHFEVVDANEADQVFLQDAFNLKWAVISADKFKRKNNAGQYWHEIHPWLRDNTRTVQPVLREGTITLGGLDCISTAKGDPFDTYDRLLPFLLSDQ